MSYYLRVEGVNLGNFVSDTNDLSTIRGGSLLLLDAMDQVETIVKNKLPTIQVPSPAELKKLKGKLELDGKTKSEWNKFKKKNKKTPPTITKGASWGLFNLDVEKDKALEIKKDILDFFNTDKNYKHATFVVDLYSNKREDTYQHSRDRVQALNHWQQLQSPSLAITKEGSEVCAFNHVIPADSKIDKASDSEDRNQVYTSESVINKRAYGQAEKKEATFYKKRKAFKEDSKQELTQDLGQLSSNPLDIYSHLNGKIAFIYIDGNSFGYKQKRSKDEKEQRDFDTQTRKGREQVLKNIIQEVITKESWLNDKKLRLETLLWGGDEIIWVVPAWNGWWMLNEFYTQANEHIHLTGNKSESLFHGASIVFCKHNAPIHRINTLAKSLADGFAKIKPFKNKNMIAYQILESFDHVGADLKSNRENSIKGLSDTTHDLLIKHEHMRKIEFCISTLKDNNFPKRKVYQIVQSYREGDSEAAQKLHDKLLGDNRSDGITSTEQDTYKTQLAELKGLFNDSNAYWLHLLELWDYVGINKQTMEGG